MFNLLLAIIVLLFRALCFNLTFSSCRYLSITRSGTGNNLTEQRSLFIRLSTYEKIKSSLVLHWLAVIYAIYKLLINY